MNSVHHRPAGHRARSTTASVAALLTMGLIAAACGGDSKSVSLPTTVAETSAPATVAATVAPTVASTVPVVETVASTIPVVETVPVTESTVDTNEYVTLVDDSGVLSVEVPVAWSDVLTTAVEVNGVSYPRIEASTDLAAFDATYSVPGMRFLAVSADGGTLEDLLEAFGVNECIAGEVKEYDDGAFVGLYQIYTQCNDTPAVYLVIATDLVGGGESRYLTVIQAVTPDDLVVVDHIMDTFIAKG